MTNDEAVRAWIIQIHFLQAEFEFEEAERLDHILWSWLCLYNPVILLPTFFFPPAEKGVSIGTELQYLSIKTVMYLYEMLQKKSVAFMV